MKKSGAVLREIGAIFTGGSVAGLIDVSKGDAEAVANLAASTEVEVCLSQATRRLKSTESVLDEIHKTKNPHDSGANDRPTPSATDTAKEPRPGPLNS